MRLCCKCRSVIEDGMAFCPECGIKYVKTDEQCYVASGLPIIIVEQNIFIDEGTACGEIMLCNVGEKEISGCVLNIRCWDQFGDEVTGCVVKYSDLTAGYNEFFGDEKIFAFSDDDTRQIEVTVDKILFSDGSMIKSDGERFVTSNAYTELMEYKNNFIEDIISQSEFEKEMASIPEKVLTSDDPLVMNAHRSKSTYFMIPQGVTKIGRNLLLDTIRSITIPDTVTEIEEMALMFCKNLISIVIPDSVRVIGESAFSYCDCLKSIKLSKNLREIGEACFMDCGSLESIIIPDSVRVIGQYGFCLCKNLISIVLSDNLVKIGIGSFSDCDSLKTIYATPRVRELLHNAKVELPANCQIIDKEVYKKKEEEKLQLEAERDNLQNQLNELKKELPSFESEIMKIKDQRFGSVPSEKEKESTMSEITSLRMKQSKIGIFKGKEKKEMQSRINELNARLSMIDASIETERKELQQKCSEKIREIEEKEKPIKEKIADIQKRIDEINEELAKVI